MTSRAVLFFRGADRRRAGRLCAAAVVAACFAPSPAQADSVPVADCGGGPVTQTIVGGSPLYVIAQAPVARDFGATFDGLVRTATTSYFAPRFATPVVTVPTQLRLVLTCSGADGAVASEYTIIVLPRSGNEATTMPAARNAASARSRPSVGLTLVLYSVPAIIGLAALVLWRRRA